MTGPESPRSSHRVGARRCRGLQARYSPGRRARHRCPVGRVQRGQRENKRDAIATRSRSTVATSLQARRSPKRMMLSFERGDISSMIWMWDKNGLAPEETGQYLDGQQQAP